MIWDVVDTGVASALDNMRYDADLLEGLGRRARPVLHVYDWKDPTATYGYFIRPDAYLRIDHIHRRGLTLARRPTGGGIVFHMWDLAFSVLVPATCPLFSSNTLYNYAMVNGAVKRAVAQFCGFEHNIVLTPKGGVALDPACNQFCMATSTQYDVVLQGKKVAGAAQRQKKQGYLHQGTISLCRPDEEYLKDVLKEECRVLEAMRSNAHPILPDNAPENTVRRARIELQALLHQSLSQCTPL